MLAGKYLTTILGDRPPSSNFMPSGASHKVPLFQEASPLSKAYNREVHLAEERDVFGKEEVQLAEEKDVFGKEEVQLAEERDVFGEGGGSASRREGRLWGRRRFS